jgi:hypothetical protein
MNEAEIISVIIGLVIVIVWCTFLANHNKENNGKNRNRTF